MSEVLPSGQKLLGAFYTPPVLSEYLVRWAIDRSASRVLEPACGEAVFLLAAARRLAELGAPGEQIERNLVGFDIDAAAAAGARRLLADEIGLAPSVEACDFFDVPVPPDDARYDAAIGNPPWIRYHHFEGGVREQAQRIAEEAGVTLSGLASSWAAFVVHAASCLKPDGRLAFVLPAELLTTDYADPIRRFLARRFAQTRVVTFRDRVFPGALVDAVLLMASGEGPGDVEVVQVQNASELSVETAGVVADGSGKWNRMLLPAESIAAYDAALRLPGVRRLGTAMSVDIGVVTGANTFFVIDSKTRMAYQLPKDTKPVLPKTAQLGAAYRQADWQAAGRNGEAAWLFMPKQDAGGAHDYIEWGESQGYSQSYKCKARKTWWKLREFPPPDFFLAYMAHKAPRFAANEARVGSTNLVHQVRATEPLGIEGPTLAAGFYNSLTLLSAELEGRTYGGGVLKLETKEAERLGLPLDVDRAVWGVISKRADLVDAAVRRGDFEAATDLVDPVLLGQGLGLRAEDSASLRRGWDAMRTRREERGRSRP